MAARAVGGLQHHTFVEAQHEEVQHFPLHDCDHNLLSHVCNVLEESGVHNKVSCGVVLVENSIHPMKYKVLSGLQLPRKVEANVNVAALRQLPDCVHLTSLYTDIPMGDLTLSSALAERICAIHVRAREDSNKHRVWCRSRDQHSTHVVDSCRTVPVEEHKHK